MSYASRQEAFDAWIPWDATILVDNPVFVVYTWRGNLTIVRFFSIGSGDRYVKWHTSVDFDKPLTTLGE